MTTALWVERAQESATELKELAGSASQQVRRQVSAHPPARSDVVVALASEGDRQTRAAVATRPDVASEAGVSLDEDRGDFIAGLTVGCRTPNVLISITSCDLQLVSDSRG